MRDADLHEPQQRLVRHPPDEMDTPGIQPVAHLVEEDLPPALAGWRCCPIGHAVAAQMIARALGRRSKMRGSARMKM